MAEKSKAKSSFGGATLVAAGMLLSRLAGLVRMRALAHFLGDSEAGDAFYAAIKIPNFPQNLLGEGVLSASFIPVYANLLAHGDEDLASKVAGTVLSILTLVVSFIVLAGIAATPYMIDLIAPGFHGEKRELTIQLVQIIFPATGLLVISAWCLGILNSHHRFFLSYAAPVFSNLAVVFVLFLFRHEPLQHRMAMYAGWGLVLGAALQLLVQVPTTLRLAPKLRFNLDFKLPAVREILKNFVPVVVSRGVVQLSAYIDSILASFLPSGAVAALGYAQAIYMLPIGLFGMSISAAELPSMSKEYGNKDFTLTLQRRINAACRRIAFFVVPSVVGFLLLGDTIAGLLFQTGEFNGKASTYVWTVLAGSAVGLLASTLGRLYSSAFYSLRDTRTPLRFSLIRVFLTTLLGYLMGLKLPPLLGLEASWGTAGLTASAGIAGWVEFLLLRRSLNRVVGKSGLEARFVVKLWIASLVSGAAGFALKTALPLHHPFLRGVAVLAIFGLIYFPLGALLGIDEAKQMVQRGLRVIRR
ncbi:MAG: murein biosynthesis integral membrane protein MurJ [Bdellovibrionota bacterium]